MYPENNNLFCRFNDPSPRVVRRVGSARRLGTCRSRRAGIYFKASGIDWWSSRSLDGSLWGNIILVVRPSSLDGRDHWDFSAWRNPPKVWLIYGRRIREGATKRLPDMHVVRLHIHPVYSRSKVWSVESISMQNACIQDRESQWCEKDTRVLTSVQWMDRKWQSRLKPHDGEIRPFVIGWPGKLSDSHHAHYTFTFHLISR